MFKINVPPKSFLCKEKMINLYPLIHGSLTTTFQQQQIYEINCDKEKYEYLKRT